MSFAPADQMAEANRRIDALHGMYEALLEQVQNIGDNHPTQEETQAMLDEAMVVHGADLRGEFEPKLVSTELLGNVQRALELYTSFDGRMGDLPAAAIALDG